MAKKQTASFDEINVKRINIVDEDGVTRLAIASKYRYPNPIISGKEIITNRRPSAGMIFFNDDGDECGGMGFGNKHAEILFDQYLQDQIVGFTYDEKSGRRYGFNVWDRVDTPIIQMVERRAAINAMPDGPEKDEARRKLEADFAHPVRVFVGKEPGGSAGVVLTDSAGRERIRIAVGADDVPTIQVLDEQGRVVFSLPPVK